MSRTYLDPELDIDDEVIDRAIILMCLTVTRRLVRKTRWPFELKRQVFDRLDDLVDEYRHPKSAQSSRTDKQAPNFEGEF